MIFGPLNSLQNFICDNHRHTTKVRYQMCMISVDCEVAFYNTVSNVRIRGGCQTKPYRSIS
jgi:hypothetical protein